MIYMHRERIYQRLEVVYLLRHELLARQCLQALAAWHLFPTTSSGLWAKGTETG